ncbi:MAG: uroporphyrinogen-III synthase [Alphaproteobacteria bacterium]
MRALVTRPAEDAARTAAGLAAHGVDGVLAPLLEIEPVAGRGVDLAGVRALLVTSANGARALAAATERRDLLVLAVGDASARTAREAGFRAVEAAGGDVDSLAALVRTRLAPHEGALLHVAGRERAGDLVALLAPDGFTVWRAVLYRARPVEALPDAAAVALRDETLDAVLLYSPRTAGTFVRLVCAAGLAPSCARLAAICLSEAVADVARALPWHRVVVAAAPTEDELFAALAAAGPATLTAADASASLAGAACVAPRPTGKA